ncbi:alpha/beta hydrolase [Aquimarina sp. 2201CG14-23]|uniref:alpha/beta hydrolase n=1 Tax=Aquimarina mycalae TaxID=3040073 RepID=UPI002477EAD8|nr:alpha/beta hydrolase [Aquimarina sp. 2201CG14-23]MDH7445804.1 alpha/beta hydrolase [Aquimarina sp. 2201CG14-23]
MSKLKSVLKWTLIVYLMGLGILYFFQQKIIFQPKKLPTSHIFQFDHPFEEFFIETKDGERLNAIHFKNKNPKGVILYFHGNRGSLSKWGRITSFFAKKQYDVIVMDYRSYGKSTGSITEENLYEDAQLFYEYTLKKYKENQIIIYGRSLGTGIATKIASTNQPANLILETPYNTLEEVTSHWLPMFPVKNILKYKFTSNEYIKKVTCDITIYHGTDDGVVPYASGRRLFENIQTPKKRMISIEGGTHNDLIEFDEYIETIDQTLNGV